MYIEIPNVPGTPESRLAALKESRELLKGEPATKPVMFAGNSTEPGKVAESAELINLATYIETGHAYADLHPTGKRRPIIKTTNVTVVAPNGVPSQEDIDHLIGHIENGDFAEFMDSIIKEAKEKSEDTDVPDADSPK